MIKQSELSTNHVHTESSMKYPQSETSMKHAQGHEFPFDHESKQQAAMKIQALHRGNQVRAKSAKKFEKDNNKLQLKYKHYIEAN